MFPRSSLSPQLAARLAKVAVIPLALVGSGVLVGYASHAAYSDTTTNPTNNWAAGTVELADDDADAAMFTVSNLKPGDSGSRCIAVTSSGSLPSQVRLYAGGDARTTKELAAEIELTVTQGTGGSFAGGCDGFVPTAEASRVFTGSLNDLALRHQGFASGVGTWFPTGASPETRVFRFDFTLSPTAPNSSQDGSASGSVVWEAQNT